MKLDGFRMTELEGARTHWLQSAPYAVLRFIAINGAASRSQLGSFLNLLGIDDSALRNDIVAQIVDALLRSGDLFEPRPQIYSALPPYAVQVSSDEWAVHGSTEVDIALGNSPELYEINASILEGNVLVRRILVAARDDALAAFAEVGVSIFERDDVLELIPDVRMIALPRPWEGFEPGPYAEWESFDARTGLWRPISRIALMAGLCRGIAMDAEGKRLVTRYFWRHDNGWSPLTAEDADCWVLRLASQADHPVPVSYDEVQSVMTIGGRVPYPTFVALKYLAKRVTPRGSEVVAEGIDKEAVELIRDRLLLAMW